MEQAARGPRCGGRRRARLAARQGERRLAPVRRRQPERDHARRAVLRRRQRLHPDLRAHARREHGPRLALPARRLPGARDAGRLVHRGLRPRPVPERGGDRRLQPLGLGRPAPAGHRHHRGRRRADPAGLPAVEPGAGPAPGPHHDRPVGDLRGPDAGGLRQDRPGRRGRPRHGLGAWDQRPARLRRGLPPGRAAGRPRGRARRHDDLARARRGHLLPPQLADRRDHRRHGLARRRRDRGAGAGPRGRLRGRVPRVRRHRPDELLHPRDLRPPGTRAGGTPAGPVREAGVTSAAPGRTSWPVLAVVAALAALAPLVFTDFFVSVILTKSLWLGVAAASLIFLSAYGGMVSLAQVGIYGVAGMAFANLVAADGGSAAAWAPWPATIAAILIAVAVGLVFGAIAARSVGIYFLMITLAFSVLVFYFFSQVTQLSGFGGVNNVDLPGLVGEPGQDPTRLYYTTLVVAILVFVGLRYASGTAFGLALQGLRDEPNRMRALGFNVTTHRILAFGLAAFVAAIAGVLSVWYNRRITPGSINLAQTIDVLIIAVIGGLYRLEGAWVGALTYALLDNYSREWTPRVGDVLGPERFNTILGVVFLVIVLVSPGGLMGLWQRGREFLGRRRPVPPETAPIERRKNMKQNEEEDK